MMKIIKYPQKKLRKDLIKRPEMNTEDLFPLIKNILGEVKKNGDKALFEYNKKFDKALIRDMKVNEEEFYTAMQSVSPELKSAIKSAAKNIEEFHRAQKQNKRIIETAPGLKTWRKAVGIEKVGLYIPGGSVPLFSSVLMLGIPAKLAGCTEIIICTPPGNKGEIHPALLYSAQLLGMKKIFKVGGAQAIASMAYGTETIPQVYKIYGPGNQYVTKAKELVQAEGIAVDMPAGPSELLIIADSSADPEFIAADLLSQAEHGPDSQVILLSDDQRIIEEAIIETKKQLKMLPRKKIAEAALKHSRGILLETLDECLDFSNEYAPEHLIISTNDAEMLSEKVTNAGSVFIGEFSCESAGDYASGTNHTLPTNGYAKNFGGLSLESFQKYISFQEINKTGLQMIGHIVELMADAEMLYAHKNAVSIRLKKIIND